MPKFILCPSCEGSGGSSAYLGSFTSDDMHDMDDEFMDDYFAGRMDRKCDECNGQRVVRACMFAGCEFPVAVVHSIWTGRTEYPSCFTHSDDAQDDAECQAQSAAERAFGA